MNQEQTLKDILDTVVFLKDHAASKEDLKTELERFATKEDLQGVKSEVMAHVDGFIVLYKKIEDEQTASLANYQWLEGHLRGLAKHVNYQLREA
ncbi:MAG: hypothetical protein V1723_04145 [Candidatus Uhrbacteria bacterium]